MNPPTKRRRPGGAAGFRLALHEHFSDAYGDSRAHLIDLARRYGALCRAGADQRRPRLAYALSAQSLALYDLLDSWAQLGQLPQFYAECHDCLLVAAVIDYGVASRTDDPAQKVAQAHRLLRAARALADALNDGKQGCCA